jgi:hypothetical protein
MTYSKRKHTPCGGGRGRSIEPVAQRSEEQTIDRLFALENEGMADRRAELTDERFLSLIHDPDSGRAYVFQHGLDDTEGTEVPEGTEFWEYATVEQAEQAYEQQLGEARAAGELVEEDSDENLGDEEVDGAELRDVYSADDDDPLVVDEEGEPSEP